MAYPDGTVVLLTPTDGTRQVVYIRNHPTSDCQWRGTDGSHVRDSQIDNWSTCGAITELLSPSTMPVSFRDLAFTLVELEPLGSYSDEAEEHRDQMDAEDRVCDAIAFHRNIEWEFTS